MSNFNPYSTSSLIILVILALPLSFVANAQVYTNKEVGQKNQQLIDSLKVEEYPYSLPILGAKATTAGYTLPYSAGLSIQYFGSKSDIVIDNLKVGFNNGPMYDLDEIVRFEDARATASAITVRPDIWLFPFLNVYGILGASMASTDVRFGVWVTDPETGIENELLNTNTIVEFQTSTFGLGVTPTIGVGGGFLALDLNVAWTDVPQLKQPARSFVFGPRFGKTFKFKNPDSNIAIWVGGFRVAIASETDGSINLSEVISDDAEFGAKIDEGIMKVEDAQIQVDTWWDNLTPVEQNSPVNKAKYETANNTLEKAGGILAAADDAVNNITNSSVQYTMTKQVKDHWNLVVGTQYQINKHLMLRIEGGFLGSRNQIMGGLQYRFGL